MTIRYRIIAEDAATLPINGVKTIRNANSAGPIPATFGIIPTITTMTDASASVLPKAGPGMSSTFMQKKGIKYSHDNFTRSKKNDFPAAGTVAEHVP